MYSGPNSKMCTDLDKNGGETPERREMHYKAKAIGSFWFSIVPCRVVLISKDELKATTHQGEGG